MCDERHIKMELQTLMLGALAANKNRFKKGIMTTEDQQECCDMRGVIKNNI